MHCSLIVVVLLYLTDRTLLRTDTTSLEMLYVTVTFECMTFKMLQVPFLILTIICLAVTFDHLTSKTN